MMQLSRKVHLLSKSKAFCQVQNSKNAFQFGFSLHHHSGQFKL